MEESESAVELLEMQEAGEPADDPLVARVAVSSSVMALLAAVMALAASFSANDALIEELSAERNITSAQTALVEQDILQLKVELLTGMSEAERQEAIQRLQDLQGKFDRSKSQAVAEEDTAEAVLHSHHVLAASVTLLQVGIVIGGMATLMRRRSMWYVSLAAALLGLVLGCGALVI